MRARGRPPGSSRDRITDTFSESFPPAGPKAAEASTPASPANHETKQFKIESRRHNGRDYTAPSTTKDIGI